MAFPEHMHLVEKRIIGKIIRRAFARGYTISIYDGEEWSLKFSNSFEAVSAETAATDMTHFRFRDGASKASVGAVVFVHGNEDDVVCDYTDNPIMREICGQ